MGAEETSFGRTQSETTPAFYARDAALGWRLCHLGLEGAFSHKGANRRNVSSPRMHSSEKRMWPASSMGGGTPIGGVFWAGSIQRHHGPRATYHGP